MADLNPEPIAQARGRGDCTIHFACNNGRENGPYDLDGFSIMRGDERIAPKQIRVEGQTIVATYQDQIEAGDIVMQEPIS